MAQQCRDRFDQVPTQVCHEWNTVAHLNEYEGRPQRRPLTYGELQGLFDYLDDRVDADRGDGPQGLGLALRDALMIKTAYAYRAAPQRAGTARGRRPRPNPHEPAWGSYGAVHVRFGKAVRGGLPRRRTVLTVPEFDWIIDGCASGSSRSGHCSPPPTTGTVAHRAAHPVSTRHIDQRFADARDALGLDPNLTLHCLRHS